MGRELFPSTGTASAASSLAWGGRCYAPAGGRAGEDHSRTRSSRARSSSAARPALSARKPRDPGGPPASSPKAGAGPGNAGATAPPAGVPMSQCCELMRTAVNVLAGSTPVHLSRCKYTCSLYSNNRLIYLLFKGLVERYAPRLPLLRGRQRKPELWVGLRVETWGLQRYE